MSFLYRVLLISALMVFGFSQPLRAQLQRDLTPTEVTALSLNVQKNPHNLRARLFLSHHYYTHKMWPKVVELLRPVTEKLRAQSLVELGSSYLQMKKNHEAETIASIVLGQESIPLDHYLFVVKVYDSILFDSETSFSKEDLKNKLFNTLKQAQMAYPDKVDIYDLWLEQLEKHIQHFAVEGLRVVEDMKKNKVVLQPRHYSQVCRFNFLSDFTKEASISCQQAIIKDGENPSNLIYLGKTQMMTGEEEKGKRTLASVGKKFADSEFALWETANSYYESKNLSAAYSFYKKASEHPDKQPRDFLGLAKTAFELKKYDIALNAFVEHCRRSQFLDQEFRRASGLLKDEPRWQKKYRDKMTGCKPIENAKGTPEL